MVAICDNKKMVKKPDIAQCLALLKILEICKYLNFQKVILEGDAKIVIMAVESNEEIMSYSGHLINDIRQVFKNRCEWSIQFAYRDRNMVA